MIFEFYPWKIEVDVEKTRKYYQIDVSRSKLGHFQLGFYRRGV